MGDYISADNIKKSFDEYYKIIKEFSDLCGGQLDTVAGKSSDEFKMSFAPTLGADNKGIFPHTTDIIAGNSDLFDFGKPKIIRTNQRVWTSDYFRIQCRIVRRFNIYEMNLGRRDSDGTRIQDVSESSIPRSVRLEFFDSHFGLKDWPQHREKIEENILEYLPKEPATKLEDTLEKASIHRDKWIKQIKIVMSEMMELTKETQPIVEPAERYAALEIDT